MRRRARTQTRRFVRATSGQSLLELALMVPILFALVVGVVDIGRYAHFRILVTSAARAGAEYGSLNSATAYDAAGMKSAAANAAPTISGLTANPSYACTCTDGTVTTCTPTACSANHRTLQVSVTATATFKPLFNYPFVGQSLTVTRTVTEQVPQ